MGCSKLSTIQPAFGAFRFFETLPDLSIRRAVVFILGAVTQLAECRIVYPVVAGSNPVSLAFFGVDKIGGAPARRVVSPLVVRVYMNYRKSLVFFRKKMKNLLTICRYIV